MNKLEIDIEVMLAAGLGDEAIIRLANLRNKIADGLCDDLTLEYKRSMFLKHLYTGGRFREWNVEDSVDINSQS